MECIGRERMEERFVSCGQRRSAEAKEVRARLMWEACFPSGVMVISGPSLLPRRFSGSMALLKPQFVFMSTAPVTTKDHEESWDLGSHMWPCLCPKATPLQGLSCSEWLELPHRIMVASGGELLLNVWIQESTARVLVEVCDFFCHCRPCNSSGSLSGRALESGYHVGV